MNPDLKDYIPPTTEEMNRRIRQNQEAFGYVHLGNIEAVADRMRAMMTGRAFTFVALNVALRSSWPEVRAGQRLDYADARKGTAVKVVFSDLDDGRRMGHLLWHDTYGVGGFSTTFPDLDAAHAAVRDSTPNRDLVSFTIKGGFHPRDTGKIEIAQYNGMDEVLRWVIALDPAPDPDVVAAMYAQARGVGSWHDPGEEAVAAAAEAIRFTSAGWEDVDTNRRG